MLRSFCVLVVFGVAASASAAEEWGDLSLRIVYDGPTPKPAKVFAAAGVPFCGGLPLVADDLLVNAKDGGVANVFVYLFESDTSKVPIHSSYAKSAKDEVKMANKGCAFEPKAIAMRTSQTFIGQNPDPVGHNMKFSGFANPEFNVAIAAGGEVKADFPRSEITPAPMQCSSHPWMKGYVLIRDDPYFAISDASGKVTIENLPAGTWNFRVWHERIGFVNKGTLAGQAVEWPRGRIKWEIKPGKNDLGELLLKPEAFK
jgi:hypothetical protein